MDLKKYIEEFFEGIVKEDIRIDINSYKRKVYNEYSLQYELANYLKDRLNNYYVRVEKNIRKCKEKSKSRIDIVLINKKDEKDKYAIELKFPINGQYPEQMYKFIEDIEFMEEAKEEYKKTYCVTLVKDRPYYSGKIYSKEKIYNYFRKENSINIPYRKIIKPTGKKDTYKELSKEYKTEWKKIGETYRYYILEV